MKHMIRRSSNFYCQYLQVNLNNANKLALLLIRSNNECPVYAAQRHVVYLWIRFAKEAMQHVSAPEPCRGQHSKCNDSNAEEVACSSVLCIKASALSNKFLPFSALLLALVLFLMYFPELITWWPSILGHYPKYFIWLVDPIATTKVKRNWRLRIIKGNNLVLCSLYQVSPQKFYV